jgi:hypothetical protein
MYVHFMTWKDAMRHIDFKVGEQPPRFRITRRGIWSARRPIVDILLERFEENRVTSYRPRRAFAHD